MDLINKYLDLAEAWPGTPEWKKKHDPSYNPYDPEGKMKKALKLQPYGYRDKASSSDEDETPTQQPAMKKRGRPKKMKEEVDQIEELKSSTMMSYKDKANEEIKALDKEVKTGEYKDIAAKIMDRRMKGADRAANKLATRKEEVEKLNEMDKSQPASSRGAEGLPLGKKAEPAKTDKVKSDALKALQKQYKKEEVEEIEELSKATLASYAKKAVTDARFKQGIGKDYEALGKRKRDPNTKAMFARMGRKVRMKAQDREKGAAKAIDRLAKEEVIHKYLKVEQKDDLPFKADKPRQIATPGKYGAGYSTAKHLAQMGLKAALKDLKKGPEKGKRQVS